MLLKKWLRPSRDAHGRKGKGDVAGIEAAATEAGRQGKLRITFFGGKGGVGKTTCSSAYALALAQAGYRTLLVSTDPAHSVGDLLQVALKEKEQFVRENLYVTEIDPEAAAERYMQEVKTNVRGLVAPNLWKEVERQMHIAAASPGADEAALFDEMVATMQRAQTAYDHLVFDTAPTGHTLRLLSLPELMGVWIEGMIARREKTQEMHRMLHNVVGTTDEPRDQVYDILQRRKNRFAAARTLLLDDSVTSFYFVLNPERLPIVETAKAVDALTAHDIPIGGFVVNRVLPPDADGNFLQERREQEQQYLRDIAERFAAWDRLYIPLKSHDIRGLSGLATIAPLFREMA